MMGYRMVNSALSMSDYKVLAVVGTGTYGTVYDCRERRTRDRVAIKVFDHSDRNDDIRSIARRETRMLRRLKHPNLINLLHVFTQFGKNHLVFEYVEQSLLDEMRKNEYGLSEERIRDLVWQMSVGIDYMHRNEHMHRDIKPENVLITDAGVVKLCDFGFVRSCRWNGTGYEKRDMTDYVATRWYRAPELLVRDPQYSTAIDVWALGCVLAEMFHSTPLWPGNSDSDQLYRICQTQGELIQRHAKMFLRNMDSATLSVPEPEYRISLRTRYPDISDTALQLLQGCLNMDPDQRLDSKKLLGHAFFDADQSGSGTPRKRRRRLPTISEAKPLIKKVDQVEDSSEEEKHTESLLENLEALSRHRLPPISTNQDRGDGLPGAEDPTSQPSPHESPSDPLIAHVPRPSELPGVTRLPKL